MAISRRKALTLSGLAVASSALSGCTKADEAKPEKQTTQTSSFKAA